MLAQLNNLAMTISPPPKCSKIAKQAWTDMIHTVVRCMWAELARS